MLESSTFHLCIVLRADISSALLICYYEAHTALYIDDQSYK